MPSEAGSVYTVEDLVGVCIALDTDTANDTNR